MHFLKIIKNVLTSVLKIVLFFVFPVLVVWVSCYFLIPQLKFYLKEAVGFTVMALFLICIVLLLPKFLRKGFSYFSIILLSFLAFVKISFYHHYGVKLSASALFVIFETNNTEASEFLYYYLDTYTLALAMLMLLFIAVISFFLFSKRSFFSVYQKPFQVQIRPIVLFVVPLAVIGLSVYFINRTFAEENILYKSYHVYNEYKATKKVLKGQLAKKSSENLNIISTSENQQTYIVIIGESTTRRHLQLYGYRRETNPKLSAIKDNLLVFDSVISPNVHTILSLEKICTLSNFKEPNKKENGSIVQLANQAGFKTYWISNQRPVGIHESIPTLISGAATVKNYIATDNYSESIYDEALLPYINKAINDKEKKKVIFVHLIGTHSRYGYRYPKNKTYFKDNPNTTFSKTANAIETINEYDNAVRYNDSIVNAVIKMTQRKKENSYVLYFSDHGDDVFDTSQTFLGHNEFHGTKPMYEVPFIFWASETYKNNRSFFGRREEITTRRYNLEDFIHTFSHLSDIDFDKKDLSRSIFSETFKSRPRIIKKGEDYDAR